MSIFAFPSGHNPKTGTQESGMTLRDYFAAKTIQSLLPIYGDGESSDLCKQAYKIADAMMKERDL